MGIVRLLLPFPPSPPIFYPLPPPLFHFPYVYFMYGSHQRLRLCLQFKIFPYLEEPYKYTPVLMSRESLLVMHSLCTSVPLTSTSYLVSHFDTSFMDVFLAWVGASFTVDFVSCTVCSHGLHPIIELCHSLVSWPALKRERCQETKERK